MSKKKAVGYVRVSTEEQALEGYSLAYQREEIKRLCDYEKVDLLETFSDDGISGATLDRDGLSQLLKYIECEDIDYLIVYTLSRLSRKIEHIVQIQSILESNTTILKTCDGQVDTSSAMGKYFLMFASIFADLERETIIARVKGGMSQKATQGGWNGGIPPLGYNSIDKQLVVNEEEKEIVEFIFSEYLQGSGYLAIVDKLKEQGYKTKTYVTKKGKVKQGKDFSGNTVKGILQNNTYKGYMRWDYRKEWGKKDKQGKRKRKYNEEPILVKGVHKAIIDEETFDRVQEMIKKNPRHNVKRFNGSHLLSGLLRCPDCGYGMSYQKVKSKGREYEYYSCNLYQNKKQCKSNSIRKNAIEEEFFTILDKLLSEKDFQDMMKEVANGSSSQLKEVEDIIDRKLKQIEKLNRKRDNLMDRIAEGIEKTQDAFMTKINNYSSEIEDLESSIKKDKRTIRELKSKSLDVDSITEVLEKAGKVIKVIEDKEAKQRLVRRLISKIETKDKNICKIHLTFGGTIDVLGLYDEIRTVPQMTAVFCWEH